LQAAVSGAPVFIIYRRPFSFDDTMNDGRWREFMPLFEYRCPGCGAEFETLVLKASEKTGVKCPVCDSRELEEKLSSFASGPSASADCAPSGG
jgi:putative FmdB family regulatory protein